MKLLIALCVLCLAKATEVPAANRSEEADCAMKFTDNGVCACSWHNAAGLVTCDVNSNSIKVKPCYCMYYDSTQNLSIVGHCFFTCYHDDGAIAQINNTDGFNDDICNKYWQLHRTKRFCGQCKKNYSLAAYSYQLFSCIPCQNYSYRNWLQYFAAAFLPLTFFYVLAVLLSFNITSSSFNGIILVIQCILSPLQIIIVEGSHDLTLYDTNLKLLKAATSIFCTVNLDFFRLLYRPFCLHPKANVFQILSLDYLVALYPFLLIFLTYLLVTAYDKQYRLVVWMWRPVQRCVHYHRNTWNIRTSLIEIFATFILFSYVKILGVSMQILSFTLTFDISGNRLKHYYTLYDGTKYFGPGHRPYALLAIAISFVFVVLPFLLLVVYPCRCFHKCLNYCRLKSQSLHIFMDAFQGSYKTHPRDLRYFSAFYLFLRILMLAQPYIFTSLMMLFTSGILSLASAAIMAIFQPYKVKMHNTIDSVLLMLMGAYFITYYARTNLDGKNATIVMTLQGIVILLLLLYFVSLIMWKLLGGKLKGMVSKAKVAWSYFLSYRNRRKQRKEAFNRDLDISEGNSYARMLHTPEDTLDN